MDLNSIKSLIITDSGKLNKNYKIILNKHKEMINYLYNYYNCTDLKECIVRLKSGIKDAPVCPVCGNTIKLHRSVYSSTCSYSCAAKLSSVKSKQTKLVRYGDANYNNREKSKETKLKHYDNANYVNPNKAKRTKLERYGNANYVNPNKAKRTKLERYGNANYVNIEKIKQNNLVKYGVESVLTLKSVRDKAKQTKLVRYDDANYVNSDKAKLTNLNKYGVTCTLHNSRIKQKVINTNRQKYNADYFVQSIYWQDIIKNKEWQQHRKLAEYKTKHKNNTFNKSKPEDECYKLLCNKFGISNVLRQYKSDLYPFNCDFYIKYKDLYIECNFHWTHNNHLYNKNNIKDIITKCKWKNKNTKFYNNAIKTWTERDVIKYKTAKLNKLNYLVFYNIKEFKDYFR